MEITNYQTETILFNSPNDILRLSSDQAREEILKAGCPAAKEAVATFLGRFPTFTDYADLVIHAITALEAFNETIKDHATGPNADPELELNAVNGQRHIEAMKQAFHAFTDEYAYMFDGTD